MQWVASTRGVYHGLQNFVGALPRVSEFRSHLTAQNDSTTHLPLPLSPQGKLTKGSKGQMAKEPKGQLIPVSSISW